MVTKRLMQLLLGAGWLLSLFYVYAFVVLLTQITLAPWDTVPTELLPDSNTWQYALNHFFDIGPGKYMLALPMVLAGLWIAWRIVIRHWQKLLELIVLNVLFLVSLSLGRIITEPITTFFFGDRMQPGPYAYSTPIMVFGYQFSIVPMLFLLLICSLWLTWQFRMLKDVQQSKQKRKREATQPDTSRLASHDNAYTDHHDYGERSSLAGELSY